MFGNEWEDWLEQTKSVQTKCTAIIFTVNLSRFGKNVVNSIVPFFDVFYLLSPAKNEALDVDRQVSTQAANLGTTHFLSPRITCFMVFKGNRGGIIRRQESVRGGRGKGGRGGGVHNVIVEPYGLSKFCQNFIVCSPPPLTERSLIFLRQAVPIRQAVCH